ncbi:MAG: hypothetical protein ACR2OE_12080 [Thermomicrobiales bacterium]
MQARKRIDEYDAAHDFEHARVQVLLVGGPSGSGKTSLAKSLAVERQMTWVQVDDLRLALQWSNVQFNTTPATDALYFFERTPNVWDLPGPQLRDALVAVGTLLSDAIAIVAANHLVQNDPVVIEGDAILPSIIEHPSLRDFVTSGQLRAVFLRPPSQDDIMQAMIRRGRGVSKRSERELRNIAHANWLYSQWLESEAVLRSLPLVPTSPWESLVPRVGCYWR